MARRALRFQALAGLGQCESDLTWWQTMAENGRVNDELLATALAVTGSRREAAEQTGVSERTVFRRLKDPAFRLLVDQVASELFSKNAAKLTALGTLCTEELEKLIKSNDQKIKLAAIKLTQGCIFKANDQFTFIRIKNELRRQLEDNKYGKHAKPHKGNRKAKDAGVGANGDGCAGGLESGPDAIGGGETLGPLAEEIDPLRFPEGDS